MEAQGPDELPPAASKGPSRRHEPSGVGVGGPSEQANQGVAGHFGRGYSDTLEVLRLLVRLSQPGQVSE
jgi:hypothetical protein